MKAQLLSLLLFAAPLMLQLVLSEGTAPNESASADSVASNKEATSPARNDAKAETKPEPAKKAPAPKRGHSIPAKLAPWLM